jgi:hypothetical protein
MQKFQLIKNTNQWWKLTLGFTIFTVGGVFMAFGIYLINQSKAMGHLLLPIGTLIGLIGALFACLFVRCPHCKTSWVWIAISTKSPNEWYYWLMELEACSKCGKNGI